MKDSLFNPFLVGKKIYLRPHEEKDIDVWFKWFNDPDITLYLQHGYFPNTYSNQKYFLENMYKNISDLQLAIVDKKSNLLIGTIGLHAINFVNRNGDVSIVIGNEKFWGKSLGREAVALILDHAFNKLNLHKVTAGMVEANIGSYKLFLSLGFKEEARLRKQNYVNGKYQDVIKMAIFLDDFIINNKREI